MSIVVTCLLMTKYIIYLSFVYHRQVRTAVKTRAADAHDQMMSDYAANRRSGARSGYQQQRYPGESTCLWFSNCSFDPLINIHIASHSSFVNFREEKYHFSTCFLLTFPILHHRSK